MLINFSNHPSEDWPLEQKEATKYFGEIVDLPFPAVPPEMDSIGISEMADNVMAEILSLHNSNNEHFFVHIMGELTLCFAIIQRLQKQGIRCLASTTARNVQIIQNSSKTAIFRFVRFREYESLIKPL